MTTLLRLRSAVRGAQSAGETERKLRYRPSERELRYGTSFILVGLAVAGLVASLLHSSGTQLSVLVAKTAIPAGAQLNSNDLAIEQVPKPTWDLQKSLLTPTAKISRFRASVPIAPGQIITPALLSLRPPAPTMRELTIPVPTGSIDPNLVQPGSRVDVVATFTQSLPPTSATLGTQLLVASFQPGQNSAMVTIDVPTIELAVAISQAIQVAKISLIGATGVVGDSVPATYPPVLPVGPVG